MLYSTEGAEGLGWLTKQHPDSQKNPLQLSEDAIGGKISIILKAISVTQATL